MFPGGTSNKEPSCQCWRCKTHGLKDVSKILSLIRFLFPKCSWNQIALLTKVQFSSVAQSCLTLSDPMNYSMPGFPVHHHLLEFAQTHVHLVSDDVCSVI